jgi:hypothetical protein
LSTSSCARRSAASAISSALATAPNLSAVLGIAFHIDIDIDSGSTTLST